MQSTVYIPIPLYIQELHTHVYVISFGTDFCEWCTDYIAGALIATLADTLAAHELEEWCWVCSVQVQSVSCY